MQPAEGQAHFWRSRVLAQTRLSCLGYKKLEKSDRLCGGGPVGDCCHSDISQQATWVPFLICGDLGPSCTNSMFPTPWEPRREQGTGFSVVTAFLGPP